MNRRVVAVMPLLCLLGTGLAHAQQKKLFAAIAYSPTTRIVGVASDNATQTEAEAVALQNCRTGDRGPPDCKSGGWVQDGCVVLAVSSRGGWGVDFGADTPTAERKATATCAKYAQNDGPTCRVARRVCTEGHR